MAINSGTRSLCVLMYANMQIYVYIYMCLFPAYLKMWNNVQFSVSHIVREIEWDSPIHTFNQGIMPAVKKEPTPQSAGLT